MNESVSKNIKGVLKLAKPIIKPFVPISARRKYRIYRSFRHMVTLKELMFKFKPFIDDDPGTSTSIVVYKGLIGKADIMYSHGYIYTFDPFLVRFPQHGIASLMSITPDYDVIIKSDLREIAGRLPERNKDNADFEDSIRGIIGIVEDKAKTIGNYNGDDKRRKQLSALFPEILYRDCATLDEAIQKLLFYNGLFWQARHWHNGLGRLDYILYPYYKRDKDKGIETCESAKKRLKDFCLLLGSQTKFKSPTLIGDTGQYILLGGVDRDGNNVDNDLTRMFLEIMTEIKVPDPKLIMRVNAQTPVETWERCVRCLFNGCGSPLFMNETLVMDNMVKFGYGKEDVWNVGTSACWEPLIIGKSSCQNNPFKSIVACDALTEALKSEEDYPTFQSFMEAVKKSLRKLSKEVVVDRDYDYSPLMSLFDSDCISRGKDFSHKGTKYMHQGAQLLSLPNLVNSLLNIKEYVYDKKMISIDDCRKVVATNYEGREDLRQLFSGANDKKFGATSKEVLDICHELIECVSGAIAQTRANGNTVKFGLSSPNFISQSKESPATLDGRRAGEPFAVHISPISSSIDISEVMQFAGKLDYPSNCLNGNVVDFILPSSYQKNPDKLVSILRDGFANGIFQLQFNVLDKLTLIDAKAHPEKYPTLVVRVWGFSAYFNDLPEEYKDNLIARAEVYEAV